MGLANETSIVQMVLFKSMQIVDRTDMRKIKRKERHKVYIYSACFNGKRLVFYEEIKRIMTFFTLKMITFCPALKHLQLSYQTSKVCLLTKDKYF